MIFSNEFEPLSESAVRNAGDTIRVRIISPGWGTSGYYGRDLLEKSAHLYSAGTKMYVNHPTRSEQRERPERDLNDLCGYLMDTAKYESDGLYANVRLLPGKIDFIRAAAKIIGVSHFVMGSSKMGEAEGRTGPIITSIDSVVSVDLVTSPGRGGAIISESSRPGVSGSLSLDADEELIRSYVQSGMMESTARFIVGRMGGGNDSPGYLEHQQAPGPVPGITGLSEADQILIRSYIESGMRKETARNIVLNLTG